MLGILGLATSEILLLILIIGFILFKVIKSASNSPIGIAEEVASSTMNTGSKITGVIALIIMIIGLIPLLGWLNWLVIIISLIGLIIGVFGKNNGGMILNGIVLLASALRLIVGGGII